LNETLQKHSDVSHENVVYDAGDIVIDPDAEVQAEIREVFAAFTRVRVGLRGGRRVRRAAVPVARLRRRVAVADGARALGEQQRLSEFH
jgi:hypothetical protein